VIDEAVVTRGTVGRVSGPSMESGHPRHKRRATPTLSSVIHLAGSLQRTPHLVAAIIELAITIAGTASSDPTERALR
jgi:hypothetical protein